VKTIFSTTKSNYVPYLVSHHPRKTIPVPHFGALYSSPTLPNNSKRSTLRRTWKIECGARRTDDCGERDRARERKERILQAALNVGAPIAVMHATIISTRCERLNITTRIHAEHLHPTSGFCLGKLYSRSTLGNQLRRRRAMKFKPTPAKAHAGVALFFLRRLKGKEKFCLSAPLGICKYILRDYWPISVTELTM
jgi:hypothetical protein